MKKAVSKNHREYCDFCSKMINLQKDNYVCVSTINRATKPDDYVYFHFVCWVDYFNERAKDKARIIIEQMREKMKIIISSPMFRDALREIPNFDNVVQLLETPLERKIDDDRTGNTNGDTEGRNTNERNTKKTNRKETKM